MITVTYKINKTIINLYFVQNKTTFFLFSYLFLYFLILKLQTLFIYLFCSLLIFIDISFKFFNSNPIVLFCYWAFLECNSNIIFWLDSFNKNWVLFSHQCLILSLGNWFVDIFDCFHLVLDSAKLHFQMFHHCGQLTPSGSVLIRIINNTQQIKIAKFWISFISKDRKV